MFSSIKIRKQLLGLLAVAVVLSTVQTEAHAGRCYRELKACMRNCLATTRPLTWARAVCVADCEVDYVDCLVGGANTPSLPLLTLNDPAGQGAGVTCEQFDPSSEHYSDYPTCFCDGDPSFTVKIVPLESTPLRVEVFEATDADTSFTSQGDAAFVSGSDPHFEWTGSNDGDAVIVFVAHYSSDPTEDLEQAVPFYVAGDRLTPPTPIRQSTWGQIKALYQ